MRDTVQFCRARHALLYEALRTWPWRRAHEASCIDSANAHAHAASVSLLRVSRPSSLRYNIPSCPVLTPSVALHRHSQTRRTRGRLRRMHTSSGTGPGEKSCRAGDFLCSHEHLIDDPSASANTSARTLASSFSSEKSSAAHRARRSAGRSRAPKKIKLLAHASRCC